MNNINPTTSRNKALLIVLWISITLSQVFYRLADRPGELVSGLIISVLVIALISGFMVAYTRFQGVEAAA